LGQRCPDVHLRCRIKSPQKNAKKHEIEIKGAVIHHARRT